MSAQDTMKIALDLTRVMTQFNGEPIKDLSHKVLPPTMPRAEYEKIVQEADPLVLGVFLAQVLDQFSSLESLKDMGYYRRLAMEVYTATEKQLANAKEEGKKGTPKFEVTVPWLDKILAQLEKERKDNRSPQWQQWNDGTHIGQLWIFLDDARTELQEKINKATAKKGA